MIQKQGNCVFYELKRRDMVRWFLPSSNFCKANKKGFLHCIVTGDEKLISKDIPREKNYYELPGKSFPLTSTSTLKTNIHGSKVMLCIWLDQRALAYYDLLQHDRLVIIMVEWYGFQLDHSSLSRALREKRLKYDKNMKKWLFCMTTLGSTLQQS